MSAIFIASGPDIRVGRIERAGAQHRHCAYRIETARGARIRHDRG